MPEIPRPLEGLTVLDLSRLLPGPLASLQLADLGATIIKIEAPLGGDYARYFPPLLDGQSALFRTLNRNKSSVCIDLKQAEGRAVFERLVLDADVVLESFRPGVMQRLGVGAERLMALNERLIYCALTGYGASGPLSARAGHDINYVAQAGIGRLTGLGSTPVQSGFQAADVAGGSLYAVIGILAALQSRHRTGRGQLVDVSMTDGVFGVGLLAHALDAVTEPDVAEVPPGQGDLAGGIPCYRPYRCADGLWLSVGALEPKFWGLLCQTIGRPDLSNDGLARGKRGLEVHRTVEAILAEQPRSAWLAIFGPIDACVEPLLSLGEARESAHTQARGLFARSEAGALVAYPNPQLLPESPPPAATPSPKLGEHTFEVLRSAGYGDEAIEALLKSGAISKT